MRTSEWLLGCLIATLAAGCGGAPPATPPAAKAAADAAITADFLRDAVTALADDKMGGRGPGSPGDRLAREYLAASLAEAGCTPGGEDGGWEQPFPIVEITSRMPELWWFEAPNGAGGNFRWGEDFIAASGFQDPKVSIRDAEVVFVGYGIQAPEENWDDFKGENLQGKILLVLNNDPDWRADLFGGTRRLYYGRWSYKFENAARAGAAGVILAHTTPSAGYPWSVVRTSWSGPQFELPAGGEPRIRVCAWMTEDAVRRLVTIGGAKWDALVESARSRKFQPVPLGIRTSFSFTAKIERTETANVLGLLPGSDPGLRDEVVVFTAHHDHLGVGEADETGDSIYNGALDNGVAMAQALAVARAFSKLPSHPRRSVLFAFVGAEEQGLLGSRYYTLHPTFPPEKIVANVNFELGNVWGRTRDVAVYGKGMSTLEDVLARAASEQGRVLVDDPDPDQGWYYRSDQFSFARIGVPALWFKSGVDYRDRPAGWGADTLRQWIDRHYHRPSDEVREDWVYDGLVEDARLAFFVGLEVADAEDPPRWVPGTEFEEVRRGE